MADNIILQWTINSRSILLKEFLFSEWCDPYYSSLHLSSSLCLFRQLAFSAKHKTFGMWNVIFEKVMPIFELAGDASWCAAYCLCYPRPADWSQAPDEQSVVNRFVLLSSLFWRDLLSKHLWWPAVLRNKLALSLHLFSASFALW